MKNHQALLGTLAVMALALAPACSETRQSAEKPRQSPDVKEKAQDVAEKIGDKAKEVGGKVAEGAKDVGEKVKEGAREVGSEAKAAKQTFDVKAALMLDKSIDSSHIDVDTDADTKTVTLKGTVPTAAQKAAVEKLARDKAEGYKVRNLLTVVRANP